MVGLPEVSLARSYDEFPARRIARPFSPRTPRRTARGGGGRAFRHKQLPLQCLSPSPGLRGTKCIPPTRRSFSVGGRTTSPVLLCWAGEEKRFRSARNVAFVAISDAAKKPRDPRVSRLTPPGHLPIYPVHAARRALGLAGGFA